MIFYAVKSKVYLRGDNLTNLELERRRLELLVPQSVVDEAALPKVKVDQGRHAESLV